MKNITKISLVLVFIVQILIYISITSNIKVQNRYRELHHPKPKYDEIDLTFYAKDLREVNKKELERLNKSVDSIIIRLENIESKIK